MKPLPPGATIGLLGGGQLGRMIALEGKPLGYEFVSLDPTPGGPAAQVCDGDIVAAFGSPESFAIADRCEAITFEWENVPAEFVEALEKKRPVRPGSAVLRTIQDRLVQREFLNKHGFPQTAYRKVDSAADLKGASFPSILKTRRHGYDGKGQWRLKSAADAPKELGGLILEAFVDFEKEVSIVLARGGDGEIAAFPLAENVHRNGILHTTLAPARASLDVAQEAESLAARVAEALGHVGVLAVEMFVTKDGGLLVNEIAPRVHNSGHYTWGACRTSQFAQHVRAVAGLPLGDPSQRSPAVMLNLLGDLWKGGEPDWRKLPANATLHLYGKAKAAPGRKMGHVVFLGKDPAALLAQADAAHAALSR